MKVNVTAGILTASECVRRWLSKPKESRGIKKIINFTSIASFQGGVETLAYSASKGAVLQITRAMSNEWAPSGILTNSICPGIVGYSCLPWKLLKSAGYTKSAITKHLYDDETYNARIMPGIPCRRWADGEDLAGAAVFLCSQASDYITGTCQLIDGGALGCPGLGAIV